MTRSPILRTLALAAVLASCADAPPPGAAAPPLPPPLPTITSSPAAATAPAASPDELALAAAMARVHPETIRAHTRFLADDALEGRGTGTRGYDVAARYVATQLEGMGFKPAGAGGYFQPVPLRKLEIVPAKTSLAVVRGASVRALRFGDDFVTGGDPLKTDVAVDTQAVFVGFGVTAPEQGYDDYAGIDVTGKVVVRIYGAPPGFPSEVRAYYSAPEIKSQIAVDHGAIGVLELLQPADEKRWPWKWLMPQFRAPQYRWLDRAGAPNDSFAGLHGAAFLSRAGAEAVFAGAPKTLDQVFAAAAAGRPGSFPLPASVRLHTVTRHTPLTSPNVAGVLPGSDPQLRAEHVVFTAHLDHLGIADPIDGDAIYNGAEDNASGVASVLAIAQALAGMSPAPRRSILVVAVTGEEPGLLGSDYFARFPTVPRESLVANVNIDGTPGLLYPIKDVVAYGAEHTTLDHVVAAETQRLGLELSPDPMPEEVIFIRSDQYSFVRQGIPAVYLAEGFKSADPNVDGGAVLHKWMTTLYHSPKDDMNQPLDFESAAKTTQLNLAIGYAVAQAAERPRWKPGDFFGTKFAK